MVCVLCESPGTFVLHPGPLWLFVFSHLAVCLNYMLFFRPSKPPEDDAVLKALKNDNCKNIADEKVQDAALQISANTTGRKTKGNGSFCSTPPL